MFFKDLWQKFFEYSPSSEYYFNLSSDASQNLESEAYDFDSSSDSNDSNNFDNKMFDAEKIFPTLSVNSEYLRSKYNLLINSDVILRDFVLNVRGKQYNAFLLYIDGMVDSSLLDDFVLKPLMLRNKSNSFDGNQNKVVSQAVSNNITVKKVKKFNLDSYVIDCLMPQNSVVIDDKFQDIISGVNSR